MSYLLAFVLVAGGVRAQERHLGPHVHGQATLEISEEGPTLDVDLSIPGHDAVGFEHPPTTPEEGRELDQARATLLSGRWLTTVEAAGCTASAASVVADGFDAKAKPGAHGDVDATFRFTCAEPGRLDGFDVALFAAFPALQRIVVTIVTASGAAQRVLDRPATRVTLVP
jgi:hypothetical protein